MSKETNIVKEYKVTKQPVFWLSVSLTFFMTLVATSIFMWFTVINTMTDLRADVRSDITTTIEQVKK